MATEFTWTDNTNTPLGAPLSFGALQRGVDSTTLIVRLWNELTAAAPNATTGRAILLFPLFQLLPGDVFRADVEPGLNQWLWIWLDGVIQNPDGGNTPDHAAVSTPPTPTGGRAMFYMPNMPRRFGRQLRLQMRPQGAGSVAVVTGTKLGFFYDRGVVGLDFWSKERHGNQVVQMAARDYFALIGGPTLMGGCGQTIPGAFSSNHVRIDRGSFMLGGIAMATKCVELEVDNTAADGALAAGEEYDALIVKLSTGTGAEGYQVVKGNKATAGSQVLPAAPEDTCTICAVARVANADGGGLTNQRDMRVHEGGFVRYDGAGLDVEVGASLNTEAGAAIFDDGEREITSIPGAAAPNQIRSRVFVNSQNVPNHALTLSKNQTPLAQVTANAAAIETISQRAVKRAANWYRGRLFDAERCLDGRNADTNGDIWLYGQAYPSAGVSGNISTAPASIVVPSVGGHRVFVHVTTHTAFGTLRMKGTPIVGGTELYRSTGPVELTFSSVANLAGAQVDVDLDGTVTPLVEGVDWNRGGAPNAAATSLAAAINGIGGITCPVPGAATLTATQDTVGAKLGITIDSPGDQDTMIKGSEEHLVATNEEWIASEGRFLGTGYNYPDVDLVAVTGPPNLNIAATAYAMSPFVNSGIPFHVERLYIELTARTQAAAARVRAYKVPSSGNLVLLFDSGLKSFDGGTGGSGSAPGIDGRTLVIDSARDQNDAATDTQDLDTAGDDAVFWPEPWGPREGLLVRLSDVKDIGAIMSRLSFHRLVIP